MSLQSFDAIDSAAEEAFVLTQSFVPRRDQIYLDVFGVY